MRTSDMVKLTCETCGARFASTEDANKHFHPLNLISPKPLVYVLLLPPGAKPGNESAVEGFAEAMKELRDKHPDVKFQFLPFGYVQNQQSYVFLESVLAIEL